MVGPGSMALLIRRHLLADKMENPHVVTKDERLDVNCNVPFYADPLQLKAPAYFLVYMIGIIWIIVGIRVVSERYFARAIENMIIKYKIPAR